ncbi:pyrimidine 5'-nucleotidase [Rhizoclosmatium globosum]|uniref:5'-nucleotidase n=1 Tax=Rhizoclosmatium globosum TaxID=329046 RepID=A0A1Y2BPK7_9FUNG|nr:pyrimidine 5'-nucleotidase [Rhizoclosmatium globosum]|eukprot:ORY36683.1 pyrimidine 5'-nucleotidase [Rhizoclosmatium globosum]
MVEWWSANHARIVDLNLSREDLRDIVATTDAPVVFREGIFDVVKTCTELGLPFLVFSAGLYDVIKEILEQNSLKPHNVHIVSNRMKFDGNDICVGFEEPLIHSFNKNETGVHGAPYQAAIESRPNVILMGDSMGDLYMKDGITHDTSLTIGFLNHDTNIHLKNYMEKFDIVVLDDSPMSFVAEFLKKLEREE